MNDLSLNPSVRFAITKAEMQRRREAVRQAAADSRLEGMKRGPESDAIFDAYVRGEIDVTDIVPRLKAQLGIG